MAEGTQAGYGKIGLAILVGSICAIGALVLLGGAGSGRNYVMAETYFQTPVSGLSAGSDVCFRGVKIGTVKRISFIANEYPGSAQEHARAIWVGMAIDPKLCGFGDDGDDDLKERVGGLLSKGLHATLAANILTGIAHIELNFPKIPVRDEPISWVPKNPCVPPAPTLLESASDAIPKLLSKIENLDVDGSWSNVMHTVASAGMFLETANTLVDSQQGNIAETLSSMRDASSGLRDLVDRLRENPSLLIRASGAAPLEETR